jgi:hypothetical protein
MLSNTFFGEKLSDPCKIDLNVFHGRYAFSYLFLGCTFKVLSKQPAIDMDLEVYKEKAKEQFKNKNYEAAVALYTKAIVVLNENNEIAKNGCSEDEII